LNSVYIKNIIENIHHSIQIQVKAPFPMKTGKYNCFLRTLIWAILVTPIACASFASNGAFISSIPYDRKNFQIVNKIHPMKLPGRVIPVPIKLSSTRNDNNNKTFYQTYMKQLDKNPMVTKAITTGVIQAIGDIVSQSIEKKNIALLFTSDLSWMRVLSFTLSGCLFVGPYIHYLYEFLWKIGTWQERKYGTSKTKQTMTQVFVDQTVGVAIFIPLYFYVYELIEAAVCLRLPVLLNATTKIQKEISGVFLMQYKVWPIALSINFALIPQNLRVLFSNVISLFWNVFLCMKIS